MHSHSSLLDKSPLTLSSGLLNAKCYSDIISGINDTATADYLLNSIKSSHSEVSPSTLLAMAAILKGKPFINCSSQNTFVPGTIELAERYQSFINREDLKSGQTKLKSVLAEFLVNTSIKPLSIASYNYLCNNDVQGDQQEQLTCSNPTPFEAPQVGPKGVPVGAGEHADHVVVKYVPAVGDLKCAIEEYYSEIVCGGHSTINIFNECEDSLLATPSILDLAILPMVFRVETVGDEMMMRKIVRAVAEGQSKKSPIQVLADKITSIFIPVVVYISLIVLVIWLSVFLSAPSSSTIFPSARSTTSDRISAAFEFAIAVLVIACPCGIGLAAPTAEAVGSGLTAKAGILAQGGGEAFQLASSTDIVVFDKTGTLTKGEATVKQTWVKDGQQPWLLEAVGLDADVITIGQLLETIKDSGYGTTVIEDSPLEGDSSKTDGLRTLEIEFSGIDHLTVTEVTRRLSQLGLISFTPFTAKAPISTIVYRPSSTFNIRHIVDFDKPIQASVHRRPSAHALSQQNQRKEARHLSILLLLAFLIAITFIIGVLGMTVLPSTNAFLVWCEAYIWGGCQRAVVALLVLATVAHLTINQHFVREAWKVFA